MLSSHCLAFDQKTREGSAIVALFNKLKVEVDHGGPWNSGETLDILLNWFETLGIDTNEGLITDQTPSSPNRKDS
ncbi:hypothetical protein [Streptomyces sp. NPDC058861]|uniref:hypothetical protein n=1 Tax=Streptomyces sp. NPDC058861 TaxID=3346653 RepID=UPI0036C06846